MHALVPVLTEEDAGESLWFGGGLLTFKVTSAQSGAAFLLFEHSAARGKPTPLHIHSDHDETCYVLEGELLMHLDGVEHTAGPGATVCIPRGIPHAMLVTSEVERSLWVVTPGEVMESFFRQGGEIAPNRTLPPPEIDIPRLLAAGQSTGAMQVLGPPPFPKP